MPPKHFIRFLLIPFVLLSLAPLSFADMTESHFDEDGEIDEYVKDIVSKLIKKQFIYKYYRDY